MEDDTLEPTNEAKSISWDWVPNERVGPFVFGKMISGFVRAFSLRLENNGAPDEFARDYYSMPDEDVDIYFEEERIEHLDVSQTLTFFGRNIIGMEKGELDAVLGIAPDDVDEIELGEDGDPHEVLSYFDLGLQLWLYHGKVDNAACWRNDEVDSTAKA